MFKVVFVLFHGHSFVEDDISINKEPLRENLKKSSLIRLVLIEDHLSLFQEISKLKINWHMIQQRREELRLQRKEIQNISKKLKSKACR